MIDPIQLAKRAARRFGVKTSFGKWEKVAKGGHLPLKYDGRKVAAVINAMERVKTKYNLSGMQFSRLYTKASLPVKSLVATQRFVYMSDEHQLAVKLSCKNRTIQVVRYKGINYIEDGHHAAIAARLRKDKYINVEMIDLDQY